MGFLLARIERDGQGERYAVRKLGAASIAERSERELLAGFWQMVDKQKPRLVTARLRLRRERSTELTPKSQSNACRSPGTGAALMWRC